MLSKSMTCSQSKAQEPYFDPNKLYFPVSACPPPHPPQPRQKISLNLLDVETEVRLSLPNKGAASQFKPCFLKIPSMDYLSALELGEDPGSSLDPWIFQ